LRFNLLPISPKAARARIFMLKAVFGSFETSLLRRIPLIRSLASTRLEGGFGRINRGGLEVRASGFLYRLYPYFREVKSKHA